VVTFTPPVSCGGHGGCYVRFHACFDEDRQDTKGWDQIVGLDWVYDDSPSDTRLRSSSFDFSTKAAPATHETNLELSSRNASAHSWPYSGLALCGHDGAPDDARFAGRSRRGSEPQSARDETGSNSLATADGRHHRVPSINLESGKLHHASALQRT
jgi:hypothetical protein